MREVSRECLSGDEIAEIAGRNKDGIFCVEEGGKFFFELTIKFVIAGGDA